MTIAQQLKQQGIQQEAQATALRILEKKLDIHLIAEVTQAEVKQIAKKSN